MEKVSVKDLKKDGTREREALNAKARKERREDKLKQIRLKDSADAELNFVDLAPQLNIQQLLQNKDLNQLRLLYRILSVAKQHDLEYGSNLERLVPPPVLQLLVNLLGNAELAEPSCRALVNLTFFNEATFTTQVNLDLFKAGLLNHFVRLLSMAGQIVGNQLWVNLLGLIHNVCNSSREFRDMVLASPCWPMLEQIILGCKTNIRYGEIIGVYQAIVTCDAHFMPPPNVVTHIGNSFKRGLIDVIAHMPYDHLNPIDQVLYDCCAVGLRFLSMVLDPIRRTDLFFDQPGSLETFQALFFFYQGLNNSKKRIIAQILVQLSALDKTYHLKQAGILNWLKSELLTFDENLQFAALNVAANYVTDGPEYMEDLIGISIIDRLDNALVRSEKPRIRAQGLFVLRNIFIMLEDRSHALKDADKVTRLFNFILEQRKVFAWILQFLNLTNTDARALSDTIDIIGATFRWNATRAREQFKAMCGDKLEDVLTRLTSLKANHCSTQMWQTLCFITDRMEGRAVERMIINEHGDAERQFMDVEEDKPLELNINPGGFNF